MERPGISPGDNVPRASTKPHAMRSTYSSDGPTRSAVPIFNPPPPSAQRSVIARATPPRCGSDGSASNSSAGTEQSTTLPGYAIKQRDSDKTWSAIACRAIVKARAFINVFKGKRPPADVAARIQCKLLDELIEAFPFCDPDLQYEIQATLSDIAMLSAELSECGPEDEGRGRSQYYSHRDNSCRRRPVNMPC
jgi:hypothetical protein